MICVYERSQVPENCSTCLYGPNAVGYDGQRVRYFGCGNANRQSDWMKYSMFGFACPSYWLDQNRFMRVWP